MSDVVASASPYRHRPPDHAGSRAAARAYFAAHQAPGHRAAARHDGAGDDPRRRASCPSLCLIVAVLLGGALAAGGANTDQLLDRARPRPADAPHPAPAAARPARSSPTGALVFGARARGPGLRAALGDGRTCCPPSLALSATLFYVFVYTIWLKPRSPQNIVIGGAAGRRAGARRLGGGHRPRRRRRVGAVRDRVLLDAAALLGAVAALPRRLRRGGHPDAARW